MDSNLLAQLKQWLMQNMGGGSGQGQQPSGQAGQQSPWMGQTGQQQSSGMPASQAAEASMRQAFNYPK